MGLGKMMAGDGEKRQQDDFYPTPSEVTEALLRVHSFDRVWEPACGDGAMVRVLKEHGCIVHAYDIVPRQMYDGTVPVALDFLSVVTDDPARALQVNAIITNPPFNLASQFIEQAMKMNMQRVAFVLKSTYWHAKNRHALFQRHTPSHIHPLTWRPDFMGLGRPTMEVMWCVWTRGHAGLPVYQPLPRPE